MDDMILYGGSVKATDEGKVSGLLIVYSDASSPDRSSYKDFFTPDTDYDLDVASRKRICFEHGFNKRVGPQKLGVGELKAVPDGVWIDGQFDMTNPVAVDVWEQCKSGAFGWSSGAPHHLVRREKQDNGTHRILSWPIAEASITDSPAEPRTFVSVKSLKSSGFSMQTKAELLQRALSDMMKAEDEEEYSAYCWICDLYDTTVVYNTDDGCYEASYSFEGMTAKIGTPKKVQRIVSYKPLAGSTKTLLPTERDFEGFLRDAGYSRTEATAIASHGYKHSQREAEESAEPTPEPAPSAPLVDAARCRALQLRTLALRTDSLRSALTR